MSQLEEQLALATRRIKADTTLLRLEMAIRSLLLSLERHYRPDQPRAPKGTPQGGQWIDDTSIPDHRDDAPGTVVVAAKKEDIKFIDYLVRRYGLSPSDRELLHELITRQDYTRDEIRQLIIDEFVKPKE